MNWHDNTQNLRRLHDLINRKATGTLNDLAATFGICRSAMSLHLENYKATFDAPVAYDRSRLTYYYTEPFELQVLIIVNRNGAQKKL